jgi:hypothetical protein
MGASECCCGFSSKPDDEPPAISRLAPNPMAWHMSLPSSLVFCAALCLTHRLSSTTHSLSVSPYDAVSQVLDVRSLAITRYKRYKTIHT